MATDDRLDEAEDVIVAMAEELSRVKRAAEQLREAHNDVDRLIKSAESLSEQAALLSGRGAEVFEALGELDLPGHFEQMLTRIAAIEEQQRRERRALLAATILLGLIGVANIIAGAANFIAQLVYR